MDFEPEHDLFETDRGGIGMSSLGRETCGICGRVVNPDAETEEDPDALGDQRYRELVIGNLRVLDCCFPRLESAALYLARNTNMLPWLVERLAEDEASAQQRADKRGEQREVAETLTALLGKH